MLKLNKYAGNIHGLLDKNIFHSHYSPATTDRTCISMKLRAAFRTEPAHYEKKDAFSAIFTPNFGNDYFIKICEVFFFHISDSS